METLFSDRAQDPRVQRSARLSDPRTAHPEPKDPSAAAGTTKDRDVVGCQGGKEPLRVGQEERQQGRRSGQVKRNRLVNMEYEFRVGERRFNHILGPSIYFEGDTAS